MDLFESDEEDQETYDFYESKAIISSNFIHTTPFLTSSRAALWVDTGQIQAVSQCKYLRDERIRGNELWAGAPFSVKLDKAFDIDLWGETWRF